MFYSIFIYFSLLVDDDDYLLDMNIAFFYLLVNFPVHRSVAIWHLKMPNKSKLEFWSNLAIRFFVWQLSLLQQHS